MEIEAVKFLIKGKVQGVGFRWFVLNEAQKLGIYGTVKNNYDGTVEVLAQGDIGKILKLKSILVAGPTLSRVDKIIQTEQPIDEQIDEFKVIF